MPRDFHPLGLFKKHIAGKGFATVFIMKQGFTWLQIFDPNFFNPGTQALVLWWAKCLHFSALYFETSVCVCVHVRVHHSYPSQNLGFTT
jgi:hypothetical protein